MTTILPAGMPRPVPSADGLDGPYWQGTAQHELRVQQCAACQTFRWSPEWICWRCHSFEVAWPTVDSTGVLYSFQRIWHPVSPALADVGPYITVLVELTQAGGVRMLGNYAGDPAHDLIIGSPMQAVFEDHDDAEHPYTLVHWR